MEFKSGGGIWEGLKLYDSAQSAAVALSCSAFDFVAVGVTQFRLTISEQIVKIHRRFAVRGCDLHLFIHV